MILRRVCFPLPVIACRRIFLTGLVLIGADLFVIGSSSESNGNSNKSSSSSSYGNGKQGPMSKVKESVKKHIHYSSK